MSKSLVEFKRFLAKSAATLSEHEKKLANLMLGGFDEIAAVGTAAGRRGKVLAKLIVEKGDAAPPALEIAADEAKANEKEIVRLTKVEVEHFRGFSEKHTFEFKNPYTFVYGPNGTGKSSLCEALEYGLLASIHEADSKRIPISDYIRNAISRKSVKPVLYGDTATEKGIKVKADPRSFEFCFIEKNRIDGFARVAANTPAAQQARLAALFGLEEFNAFATQFNESLDPYLDCVGKKGKDLAERAKSIAGHKAILEELPVKAKNAEMRGAVLLEKYPECRDLDEIKAALSGADGNGGKQKANNTEIGRLQNLKAAADPGTDEILADADGLLRLIKEKADSEKLLNQYKDQLSLRDLYGAILANRERFGNECPACASELYRDGRLAVPLDPYGNAEEKLKQFNAALRAEGRIKDIQEAVNIGWPELLSKIAKLPASAAAVGFVAAPEVGSFSAQASHAKDAAGIETFLRAVPAKRELLQALKDATAAHNGKIEQSKATIKKLEDDNRSISKDLEEIVAISTLIAAKAKSETEATQAIEKFTRENEELIKEAEAEKPGVARNLSYSMAYVSLREKLLAYNAGLPLALAADLNEKTLKFYNEINKNDHPSDRLRSLRLPTAVGERIEIEFENGDKCDALQVLSEGHIRCLGLAILLAKITTDRVPFLIFDDVVNSIDDEHRSAIIDLILNPEEVGKRQLIVTTHGEDFVKRLENAVPMKKYEEMVTRIDFLVPFNAKKITVKLDSPRHYLMVAVRSHEEGRTRDSLSYVRKAFEEELNRLWKKIANKKLSAQISVGMRGPGDPDLMSLATGLHQFLRRSDVTVFQEVVPHLGEMLGYGEKHKVEWSYLNKGTHEEDRAEEFDAVIVRRMLETVIKLDEAIEAPQV
ncbi:AAA family ATPase [Burkholderia multivorans]|uniref:AAA family ATPase n=1 Tax=Burkholderia multivorans TaxID=87883 RepID=UPI0020198E08|nr:AAA family ATPase [Burkholderia multivorans]MCO1374043.1 AAA family ATPase [Burkholderia multivorans]MCO1454708.1 AAA family ATPase [Burkholderia multivorans]MCO1469256.1 AAA family ATPase [Burkholderia multivorans]UQO19173.1 AAA family ATPase [Burkholderia multivorans]UQO82269.1 AAA family ATPase [Burkholderia multivorans]